MGIFGQIFVVCLGRVKEIGIRKINGATISEIVLMLNSNFIFWFFIAFIIASPAAWYIGNRWLMNFAYRTPIDLWIFILAGLMALVIILVTVSWQSLRAATRNPVDSLRYE